MFEVKEQKQPLTSDEQQKDQCKTHKELCLMGNYFFHVPRSSSRILNDESCKEQGEMSPKDEEYKQCKKKPRIFLTAPAQLNDYVFPNPPAVHGVGQLLQDLL